MCLCVVCLHAYVCACVCTTHGSCSLLLPCGFWGSNSDCRNWWQAPLPDEHLTEVSFLDHSDPKPRYTALFRVTGSSSLNTKWVWLYVAKQNLGKPREARVNSINGRLYINPSVALLPPSLSPTPTEEGLYHWAKSPAPLLWLLL